MISNIIQFFSVEIGVITGKLPLQFSGKKTLSLPHNVNYSISKSCFWHMQRENAVKLSENISYVGILHVKCYFFIKEQKMAKM